ncbi:hypothetical protein CYMTET_33774, partial [Cymbomonas tetramitiformis]
MVAVGRKPKPKSRLVSMDAATPRGALLVSNVLWFIPLVLPLYLALGTALSEEHALSALQDCDPNDILRVRQALEEADANLVSALASKRIAQSAYDDLMQNCTNKRDVYPDGYALSPTSSALSFEPIQNPSKSPRAPPADFGRRHLQGCEDNLFTLTTKVAEDADDVEEEISTGRVYSDSSDLEFGFDAYIGGCQIVGVRFAGVQLPSGANGTYVQSAELVFVADESGPDQTFELSILAVNTVDCPPFNSTNFGVSSLATLGTIMPWHSSPWTQGSRQKSSDISPLVQEIVSMDGWQPGNAMCFIIAVADACEGSQDFHYEAESANTPADDVPLLKISYWAACPSPPPTPPMAPPNPPFPPAPSNPPALSGTAHVYSAWAGDGQLRSALEDTTVVTIIMSVDVYPEAELATVTHTVHINGTCHLQSEANETSGTSEARGLCTVDGGSQRRLFRVLDGSLTLQQVHLTRGYAEADGGGGLLVEGSSFVQILSCKFSECSTAIRGGAIHLTESVQLSIASTAFESNYATADGGAVYAKGVDSVLTIDSCTFSGNTVGTSGGLGGAVSLRDKARATVNGSRFDNNTAHFSGGAMHIQFTAEASIADTAFAHNTVINVEDTFADGYSGHGGSVGSFEAAVIILQNVSIAGSEAAYGGALSLNGPEIVCEAANVTFSSSKAYYVGGCILEYRASLVLSHSVLVKCTAVQGGALWVSSTDLKPMEITASVVRNNMALYDASLGLEACAGGIYVGHMSSVMLVRAEISDNEATASDGGGLMVDSGSTAFVEDTEIVRNVGQHGGGAYVGESASLSLTHATVELNVGESGGGLFGATGSHIDITGCTVISNTASRYGGGVASKNISVQSSNLTHNVAQSGGGIYIDAFGEIISSRVCCNTAEKGGGMFLDGQASGLSQMRVRHTTVSDNTVSLAGAGLYTSSGTHSTVLQSVVLNNSAGDDG